MIQCKRSSAPPVCAESASRLLRLIARIVFVAVYREFLHRTGTRPIKLDCEMSIVKFGKILRSISPVRKNCLRRIALQCPCSKIQTPLPNSFLWYEWHAAWICRSRPARITPRNYHVPSFLAHSQQIPWGSPGNGPGVAGKRHLVGPLDSDGRSKGANTKELAGVAIARRISNASESDFTAHFTNDENPIHPVNSKSIGDSPEISETSETCLSGWDYVPPTSGAKKQ